MNLPPLKLELSLEQSLSLAMAERHIGELSRQDLEEMLLSTMRQNYLHLNTIKNLMRV